MVHKGHRGPVLMEENRVLGSEVTSSLGGEVASVKQGVLGGKGETQRSSSRSFLCNPDGCSLGASPVAGPVLVEVEVLRRGLGIPGRTRQAERPAGGMETGACHSGVQNRPQGLALLR